MIFDLNFCVVTSIRLYSNVEYSHMRYLS